MHFNLFPPPLRTFFLKTNFYAGTLYLRRIEVDRFHESMAPSDEGHPNLLMELYLSFVSQLQFL